MYRPLERRDGRLDIAGRERALVLADDVGLLEAPSGCNSGDRCVHGLCAATGECGSRGANRSTPWARHAGGAPATPQKICSPATLSFRDSLMATTHTPRAPVRVGVP